MKAGIGSALRNNRLLSYREYGPGPEHALERTGDGTAPPTACDRNRGRRDPVVFFSLFCAENPKFPLTQQNDGLFM